MLPRIINPEFCLAIFSLLPIPVSPRFYQAWNALHCKDTILEIRNKYSQKRNWAASVIPISTFMCLWAIYIQYFHNVVCLFCCRKICGLILGILYINRSQTHESGNWNWGRAIPFLEIHKWGFRSCVTDLRPSLLALSINPVKSPFASDGIVQGQFTICGQSVNPLNFVFLNISPDLILDLSLHHTLYTAFLKGCC